MARVTTYTASVINIRIIDEDKRDYALLINKLSDLKQGIVVRKNVGIAITHFDKESLIGSLSKYTEIPDSADWFNTETFSKAEEGEVSKIVIPKNLKPGLEQFKFKLNREEHLISFLTKASGGRLLSPRLVLKYFERAVSHQLIRTQFGEIEVTLVQDIKNVESFFTGGALRRLEITLRAPNDGVDKTLRKSIGAKLGANNAGEIREILKAKRGQTLTPTTEVKSLAKLGATMGEVDAVKEFNGIAKNISSKSSIEENSEKFDPDFGDDLPLNTLNRNLVDAVRNVRDSGPEEE